MVTLAMINMLLDNIIRVIRASMEIGTNVLHRAIMTQIVGDFSSALAQMVVTRICRIQPPADSREEIVE